MPIEIERKFLVKHDGWRNLVTGVAYRQGYLCTEVESTVRVRIAGDRAFLTIKGKTTGSSRLEYEYPIPLEDAAEMLNNLCHRPLIEKTRYRIALGDLVWEVDEFHGENQGLILAEVELVSEDRAIALPDWIGVEVSHDSRYYNSYLARNPYQRWQ
ncbi:MAG: CYTH domain-containing protein [Spirulinaceae cyanobacterium]